MAELHIHLFGRLTVHYDHVLLAGFEARKVQELFVYLVLNHRQTHAREVLATLLWGDYPTAQSRKLLRHTLWQLQSILEKAAPVGAALLHVEPCWVHLDLSDHVWVDALEFSAAVGAIQLAQQETLPAPIACQMRSAVDLYQSDLLEGCYQEWCLYERERYIAGLLTMLDRLILHCKASGALSDGLAYGQRILRYDRTRERTHRHLMCLYYLSGDRTEAIRQFQRCSAALSEDLGVEPAQQTLELFQQICDDRLIDGGATSVSAAARSPINLILADLKQLWATLDEMQQQIKTHIESVEHALEKQVNA